MAKFDDRIAELSEERDWLAGRVAEFRSGMHKHFEMQNGNWIDITPQLTDDFETRIGRLENLIAAYKKRNEEA